MKIHMPKAILLILLTLFAAGCGEDSPTAPAGAGNTGNTGDVIYPDEVGLYFWLVCVGDTEKGEFTISTPSTNKSDVSGDVAIGTGTRGYKITKGAGPYTLSPGESRTVEIEFKPVKAGFIEYGFVDLGYDSMRVDLEGFGSEYPKIRVVPVGLRSYGLVPNNIDFLHNEPYLNIPGSGVSYSNPSWESCSGSAWVFNGNSVAETWIDFRFNVPEGTKTVLIELDMDAAGTCAQLLMEIDGDENVRTNFGTSCKTRRYRFDISSGRHTIRIGTDQQGVGCGKDISVDSVTFTFEGRCVDQYEFHPAPNYR